MKTPIALDSLLGTLDDIRYLLKDNRLSPEERRAIRSELEAIVLIFERETKPADVSVH